MLPLWPLLLLAQVVLGQFWMEEIAHEGKSPYHPNATYQVFRNVKDFGAVGDGGAFSRDASNMDNELT
jgi:glucan 1,3-beta-glucosidase